MNSDLNVASGALASGWFSIGVWTDPRPPIEIDIDISVNIILNSHNQTWKGSGVGSGAGNVVPTILEQMRVLDFRQLISRVQQDRPLHVVHASITCRLESSANAHLEKQ